MKNTTKGFIPYFDGLRGLAALVVFFGHTACSIYPALVSGDADLSGLSILPQLAKTPFSLFTASNSAVCIFFVLSGYVMSMVSDRSNESFLAISVRRYLRLAGPAMVICIFSAWLLKHNLYFNQAVADITASSWLKQWFLFGGSYKAASIEGLFDIFQHSISNYDSSLWTMYVEFWGSMGIFSIYYLVKNKYLRLLSFFFVSIISARLFHRYDFFCIFAGALSFNLYQIFQLQNKSERLSTVCVLVGLFLCSYPDFAPFEHGGRIYNWISTRFEATWYHSFGAILIVHFIHNATVFRSLLSSPILLWLGKISFSLYLIHLPVICSLGACLIYLLHTFLTYNEMTTVFILCTGSVSLLLANIYAKSVDMRFIQFGRFVSKEIDDYFPAQTKNMADSTFSHVLKEVIEVKTH